MNFFLQKKYYTIQISTYNGPGTCSWWASQ